MTPTSQKHRYMEQYSQLHVSMTVQASGCTQHTISPLIWPNVALIALTLLFLQGVHGQVHAGGIQCSCQECRKQQQPFSVSTFVAHANAINQQHAQSASPQDQRHKGMVPAWYPRYSGLEPSSWRDLTVTELQQTWTVSSSQQARNCICVVFQCWCPQQCSGY